MQRCMQEKIYIYFKLLSYFSSQYYIYSYCMPRISVFNLIVTLSYSKNVITQGSNQIQMQADQVNARLLYAILYCPGWFPPLTYTVIKVFFQIHWGFSFFSSCILKRSGARFVLGLRTIVHVCIHMYIFKWERWCWTSRYRITKNRRLTQAGRDGMREAP